MLNSDQLTKLSNQLKGVCGQQSPSCVILFRIQQISIWHSLWGFSQWVEVINIKCLSAKELFKVIWTFLLLLVYLLWKPVIQEGGTQNWKLQNRYLRRFLGREDRWKKSARSIQCVKAYGGNHSVLWVHVIGVWVKYPD